MSKCVLFLPIFYLYIYIYIYIYIYCDGVKDHTTSELQQKSGLEPSHSLLAGIPEVGLPGCSAVAGLVEPSLDGPGLVASLCRSFPSCPGLAQWWSGGLPAAAPMPLSLHPGVP